MVSASPSLSALGESRPRRIWAKILLTCALSMGSHYGSYLLGPLKHRMHEHLQTTNTQFSLMIAAYNINSTWTPLFAGLAVSRIGVYYGAILATAIIALGQVVLLIGSACNSMGLMTTGLFLFGIAFSPLSVCQETLIYTLFPRSGNLNLIIGFGLLAGKIAAFAASITAVPLSELLGDEAPFVASAAIAAFSCAASVALLRISRDRGGDEAETSHVEHKVVRLGDLARLSNVFWIYVLMNVIGGYVWQPFLHLSSSMVEHIYGLSDWGAAFDSSVLLAGAIIMYPLLGRAIDWMKSRWPDTPQAPFNCMIVAAYLTGACYVWLLLPIEKTGGSPVLGLILFAVGYGSSSFLLVVLVPYLVSDPKYISTALGMHKAMEMSSTTLSQTLSGLFLDWDSQDVTPHPKRSAAAAPAAESLRAWALAAGREKAAARGLLSVFLAINIALIVIAYALRRVYSKHRSEEAARQRAYQPIAMSSTPSTPATPAQAFAPMTPLLASGGFEGEDAGKTAEDDEAGEDSLSSASGWDHTEDSDGSQPHTVHLRLAIGYIGLVWVVFWAVMLANALRGG